MFRDSIISLFILLLVGCSPTYQPTYYETPSYLSPPNQLPSFELEDSFYSFDEFTNSILLHSFEVVDTLSDNFIGKYSLKQIWMTDSDSVADITTTIALNTVALFSDPNDMFVFEEAEITNYGEVELIPMAFDSKEPTSIYDSALIDVTYLIRIPNEYLGDVKDSGFNVRLTNWEEGEVRRFNVSSEMVNSLTERMLEILELMVE